MARGNRRGDSVEPLVTPSSALIEAALTENAGSGKQGRVVLVGDATSTGCRLDVEWGVPKVSKQGKSYIVTYDAIKVGSMRIAVTVTLPLGKDAVRPKRETTVNDAGEFDDAEIQAALAFYRASRR